MTGPSFGDKRRTSFGVDVSRVSNKTRKCQSYRSAPSTPFSVLASCLQRVVPRFERRVASSSNDPSRTARLRGRPRIGREVGATRRVSLRARAPCLSSGGTSLGNIHAPQSGDGIFVLAPRVSVRGTVSPARSAWRLSFYVVERRRARNRYRWTPLVECYGFLLF